MWNEASCCAHTYLNIHKSKYVEWIYLQNYLFKWIKLNKYCIIKSGGSFNREIKYCAMIYYVYN